MSRLFSNIIFSFFLLFQTISLAAEDSPEANIETNTETAESTQTPEAPESTEGSKEPEAQDTLSEAQKEALAAEAAELREAGVLEEPIVE